MSKYTISAKQQLDTQCNLGLAKLKLKSMIGSDVIWPIELIAESYHHCASIRRDLKPHDPAWEKFYYDTNRFSSIAAAVEWHREDGVKPDMGILLDIRPGVIDRDIIDFANLYESRFVVFTWRRAGGMPQCCISLSEVPDEDLTDFLSIAREMSLRPLEFVAVAASPLTWKD